MWACYKGHLETARLLIEQRAEVNVHGQFHITPLMWASGRGHVDIVQLLLEHGAKVNVGDKVWQICLKIVDNIQKFNFSTLVWNDTINMGLQESLLRHS